MRIWVDADACPKPVKEIPFRAAGRVGSALTVRRFMDELRSSGVETGGPPPFNHGDRQAFANQLDSFLARCGPAKIDTKSPA